MKLSPSTINFFIQLEKKYELLSSCKFNQDELFLMQKDIREAMLDSANASPTLYKKLLKELPHIFGNPLPYETIDSLT